MRFTRSNSRVGTALGLLVFAAAVVGTVFLDWSWQNPDGKLLPLGLGVAAAVAGVVLAVRQRRT